MTKQRIKHPQSGEWLNRDTLQWEQADPGGRHVFEIEDAVSPPPDPGPVPPQPTGPIKSNFIRGNDNNFMTLLLPALPTDLMRSKLNQIRAEGWTDVDIYGYNDNDNPFGQQWWEIKSIPQVRETLEYARSLGLRTTLWCVADDLNADHRNVPWLKNKIAELIGALDPLVTRYVPLLEANETVPSTHDDLREIMAHADGLTEKPTFLHLRGGFNFGTSYQVSGIYYQFEGRDPLSIRAEATKMSRKWRDAGKLFIAGEFHRSRQQHNFGQAVDDLVDGRADG